MPRELHGRTLCAVFTRGNLDACLRSPEVLTTPTSGLKVRARIAAFRMEVTLLVEPPATKQVKYVRVLPRV